MKQKAAVVLILLLVSMSSPIFIEVKAEPTAIHIRANGSIDPPTAPIRRDGDVYTFTSDTYGSSPSRIEMFSFVNVTVEVRDAYGRPVSGAWVKAFSEDWGITYPRFEEWGFTNSLGIYNFRLPKGEWTFIASTGWGYSNEGVFVAVTKKVDSNDHLILKPKERLNIAFIDENGVHIQPDELYVFLTRLIPALPPALVGSRSQGTFSLYVGGNLTYGLTILGLKRSTTSINYLLVGKTSLNETNVVISAKNSSEITFEAYNPDKSPSTYWDVEFSLSELYLGNWGYLFQISGRTIVKISPMKIVLNPRFIPPNWYYYFEHIYLEPKENSKYLYRLGGQFSFRFWVIKEDTQLWFDIRDEFGNVLAFYGGSTRYIKLKIYENNVVVYDKNIGPDIPGTLFYGIGKTFQDNATYSLEMDTGPLLGVIRKTGFLYSEEHMVRYINFTVNGFNFDIPEEYFWTIANQSRISVFVDSVLKLYNSIGSFVEEDLKAKPFTVKVNFEWCGIAGYRFIGFGVGVARWPLMVRIYTYAIIIAHELGHMYSFTSDKPYDVECPWFCEPLATYLGIEGIANIYGDNVRLWYWGSHPFFFDYITGKADINEVENMQFIFFYIHKMYGPAVHKEFFKKWSQASSILRRYGYSNLESVVTLYSLLVNENIAWLFNLAGFKVNSDKILEGMKIPLFSITVAIEGLPSSYNVSVYIDGSFYGYVQGGDSKVFRVDKESVTVRIEPSEVTTNDTIYKAESNTLTVNSGGKAVFRYYTKFYVEVRSDLAPAYGSGWYRRGEVARVGLNELKDGYYYTEGGKVRCRFQGWRVERGRVDAPGSSSFSFPVQEPVILKAEFGSPEYLVCIDGNCNFFEKGSLIPAQPDAMTQGGLIIKRFEGYLDPSGNNLGKSIVVNGPLSLSTAYREEVNWLILAAVLALAALALILALWVRKGRIKIGEKAETQVKEPEKTETEVRELTDV